MQPNFINPYRNQQYPTQQQFRHIPKKHLPKDIKRQIAFSLGPKPTCAQIKAVSKQYQVCQGTVYYWLRTHFPEEFNHQHYQQGYNQRNSMTQYRTTFYNTQRLEPNYQRDNQQLFHNFNRPANLKIRLDELEQEVDKQLECIDELIALNDEIGKELISHSNSCKMKK